MSQSGAHQSATCQKGVKSCQKGFPNLVETAGYTFAQAFQKGVLGHTPLLITPVHPLYSREKKKKTLDAWEEPREHDKRSLHILIWSRFDGEHGRRRRRKAMSPFLSMCFFFGGGGVPLFVKCLIII